MKQTEVLQEIRKMRFKEAYDAWQERRLSQEEARGGRSDIVVLCQPARLFLFAIRLFRTGLKMLSPYGNF